MNLFELFIFFQTSKRSFVWRGKLYFETIVLIDLILLLAWITMRHRWSTQFFKLKYPECILLCCTWLFYLSYKYYFLIIQATTIFFPFCLLSNSLEALVNLSKMLFSKNFSAFQDWNRLSWKTKIKFPDWRSADLSQSIHFLLTFLTPIIAILIVKWCLLIMIPGRDWRSNESIDFIKCSKCLLFVYSKWIVRWPLGENIVRNSRLKKNQHLSMLPSTSVVHGDISAR